MAAPALLTALDCKDQIHLIIGSNPLAGARCGKSIEVGAKPKLIAPANATLHFGLEKRIEGGQVEWLKKDFEDADLYTFGRNEIDNYVDAVFVALGSRNPLSAHISSLCRRQRIPINVADAPALCTFTLLSTHTDGPLQIGTTTSGKGCKLAARIRREVVSSLPSGLGVAVERLGHMRRRIWEEDHAAELALEVDTVTVDDNDDDHTAQPAHFNQLVSPHDAEARKNRRMRWLTQICEYWPLSRLVSITDADIDALLQSYNSAFSPLTQPPRKQGRLLLAGSGPGHPSLLTLAARNAISTSDLVLADKLVPAPIMSLIPRRSTVHIARKFPGNADAAQDELLTLALDGVQTGRTVLRLKQGDPFLYGRGAEEVAFFRERGYDVQVIPGITSALSAPLFAGIPETHRGVSDEVLICTGTGRKGVAPAPPVYAATRTVVFLMALHRLGDLVTRLVGEQVDGTDGQSTELKHWPENTPCAVIERASCPDQRVIRTTLAYVCAAVEEEGSRPPGLLVVGRACTVLWNGTQRWVVEEGFRGLEGLEGEMPLPLEEEVATPL